MVSSQRVLLVAAEPREFAGLLPVCGGVRKLRWPVHWARTAECGGKQLWMVANGAGWTRAGQAVDVAVHLCRPEAVLSMGFCGALDPALQIGDVFVASSIESAGRTLVLPTPSGSLPRHTTGRLVSLDHIAGTAEEKQRLHAGGAAVVEMEATGVVERAATYSVPAFCVKAVTDLAGQSFTVDFNQALRSDGHFDTIRILTSALRKPGQAFPELMKLSRNCHIAARSLGEFVAVSRF